MRLAWLSDLHLNFVWEAARNDFEDEYRTFCDEVSAATPDAILLSGDIAESPDLRPFLERLKSDLPAVPNYFVLGNHDFYRGSIAGTRKDVQEFCRPYQRLSYLTTHKTPIKLTEQTALVGHDGWADGRLGNYGRSDVRIADFEYIQELIGLSKQTRLDLLNRLGDEAALHLRALLSTALEACHNVIVLTHVPPFWEASRHRGKVSSPEWAPFFTCQAVGDVLIDAALEFPDRQITVLCGHTHSPAEYHPKSNLSVFAAKAEYGSPSLQRLLEIE